MQLKAGRDWPIRGDPGKQLLVPQETAATDLRADVVLWSETQQLVYVVELTVPWEDAGETASERKQLRYTELAAEAEEPALKAELQGRLAVGVLLADQSGPCYLN